jgi:hypothetical protein
VIDIVRDSAGRTVSRTLVRDPEMEPVIRRLLDLGSPDADPGVHRQDAERRRADQRSGGPVAVTRREAVAHQPMYAGILRFKDEERRRAAIPT